MVTELAGLVFEITHDLVGDLFRAKNAGVTGHALHLRCREIWVITSNEKLLVSTMAKASKLVQQLPLSAILVFVSMAEGVGRCCSPRLQLDFVVIV
jgi:hypothetical protein